MPIKYKLPPPSFKISPKKDIGSPDGDTIKIEQPLRMVSCDTPEKEKPFGSPPVAQKKLNIAKERLKNGFFDGVIPKAMQTYLLGKLTADAAKKHIAAGHDASKHFEDVKNKRLVRDDGKRRKVGVLPAGEVIDSNGRMLAYVLTYFDASDGKIPDKNSDERKTYNLVMVEDGWAAFFPVWPSLPKDPADFDMIHKAARNSWKNKKGMWKKYGAKLLLPYEYRLLIKLSADKSAQELADSSFTRLCVDLRTMKLKNEFSFHSVPPGDRLWIWKRDWTQKNKAVIKKCINIQE